MWIGSQLYSFQYAFLLIHILSTGEVNQSTPVTDECQRIRYFLTWC